MRQQPTVQLEGAPAKSEVQSPTGFVLGGTQKMVLLVVAGLLLYLRLHFRRRKRDRVCSHCGHRNPPHRQNCSNCSAPLFGD